MRIRKVPIAVPDVFNLEYRYYMEPHPIVFFDKEDKRGIEFADEQAVECILNAYLNNEEAAKIIEQGHYVYNGRGTKNIGDSRLYLISDRELWKIVQKSLWISTYPTHEQILDFVKTKRLSYLTLSNLKEVKQFFI